MYLACAKGRVIEGVRARRSKGGLSVSLHARSGWCMASHNECLSLAHHAKEAHDRAQDVNDSLATASASGAPLAPGVGGFGAGVAMAAEAYAIALVLQTVIIVRDMLVNAKTNVREPARWPRRERERCRAALASGSGARAGDRGAGPWQQLPGRLTGGMAPAAVSRAGGCAGLTARHARGTRAAERR